MGLLSAKGFGLRVWGSGFGWLCGGWGGFGLALRRLSRSPGLMS